MKVTAKDVQESLSRTSLTEAMKGEWSNFGFKSSKTGTELGLVDKDAEDLMIKINLDVLDLSKKNKDLDTLSDMRVKVVLDGPRDKQNLVVSYPREITKSKKKIKMFVPLYKDVSLKQLNKTK